MVYSDSRTSRPPVVSRVITRLSNEKGDVSRSSGKSSTQTQRRAAGGRARQGGIGAAAGGRPRRREDGAAGGGQSGA